MKLWMLEAMWFIAGIFFGAVFAYWYAKDVIL